MPWQVEFFETARGSSPPRDFLLGLPAKAQAKVARALDLLEEFGPDIGEPYVKAIRGRSNLLELRTRIGPDALRLFFYRAGEERLVVVHGIRKKSQRTPARDLDTAEERMKTQRGRER